MLAWTVGDAKNKIAKNKIADNYNSRYLVLHMYSHFQVFAQLLLILICILF